MTLKLKSLNNKYQKISQLQAEIAAYEQQIVLLNQELDSAEEKIEKTRKEFLAVYENFTESLKEDKQHFEGLL